MTSAEISAKMKAALAASEDLARQVEAEKDEGKKKLLTEMADAKSTEFDRLEGEFERAKGSEKRSKKVAEMDKVDPAVAAKKAEMTEVSVPDSQHNQMNDQMKKDVAAMDYLTNPDGGRTALAKVSGELQSALRPTNPGQKGIIAPTWIRDFCLPLPMGERLLGKQVHAGNFGSKAEYHVLTSDATGSQSGGGSLVPTVMIPELYKVPKIEDDLPSRCWVKRGIGGNAEYPKLTQSATEPFGVTVTWDSEGAGLTEHDPVFTKVTVGTNRCGCLAYVSDKELRVNAVGIEAELAWMLRGALRRSISNKILEGSGSGEPLGVNHDTSIAAGVATLAREVVDTVSYADLVGLQFAVEAGVFNDGIFVISTGSTGAMKYIAGLDDTYGAPVLRRDNAIVGLNAVPTIAGSQYLLTQANTKALGERGDVIFGDFRQYALVVDVDNMSIDRSDDYAFNSGLITYRVQVYIGGIPLGYSCFSVLHDASTESSSSSST